MDIIPLAMLHGACEKQMALVRAEWPNGIHVTEASADRALALNMDLNWLGYTLVEDWLNIIAPIIDARNAEVRPIDARRTAEMEDICTRWNAEIKAAKIRQDAETDGIFYRWNNVTRTLNAAWNAEIRVCNARHAAALATVLLARLRAL